MTVPSTGVRVSKMALHLCHSSLRPHSGATAAICWSHHWLWHHYYSPAVFTGHIAVRKAFMSKMDLWWIVLTLWLIFFSDFRTMPLFYPTPAKKALWTSHTHSKHAWKHTKALKVTLLFFIIYAHLFELHMFPFSSVLPDRCLHQILFHWGNERSYLMSTEVIIITEKLLKKTNE